MLKVHKSQALLIPSGTQTFWGLTQEFVFG